MGAPPAARQGGPDAQDVKLRFAFVVGGALAVLAWIWVLLDAPANYGCGEGPSASDAQVHLFRWEALVVQGLYALALLVVFLRWSAERQAWRGGGHRPGPGAKALLAVMMPVGLCLPFALAGVDFPDHDGLVWVVVITIPLGLLGGVAALGALFPATAAVFREDPTPERVEEAVGYIQFIGGSLIAAIPLHVVLIVFQGSGWVIGC
jgi:hypothetical protein